MPLEQALESMAVRIGNEDFHWVVMAINIQRQVGGNLAQVLETTAGTLREREQLRRQVKVLSAEGRISAVILSLLPFLLAGYMAVVNPEYVGELFRHFIGKVMVAGALGLMVAGVLWMRKLVKIEI
jgi:tight adherence protein B